MKNIFMKITVILCIIFSAVITLMALNVCKSLAISPEKIYLTSMGLFSGELVMMFAKKIIGQKEICKKNADN